MKYRKMGVSMWSDWPLLFFLQENTQTHGFAYLTEPNNLYPFAPFVNEITNLTWIDLHLQEIVVLKINLKLFLSCLVSIYQFDLIRWKIFEWFFLDAFGQVTFDEQTLFSNDWLYNGKFKIYFFVYSFANLKKIPLWVIF